MSRGAQLSSTGEYLMFRDTEV